MKDMEEESLFALCLLVFILAGKFIGFVAAAAASSTDTRTRLSWLPTWTDGQLLSRNPLSFQFQTGTAEASGFVDSWPFWCETAIVGVL